MVTPITEYDQIQWCISDGYELCSLDGYLFDGERDGLESSSLRDKTSKIKILDWMDSQESTYCVIDGRGTWFDEDEEIVVWQIAGITSNYSDAIKMCNLLTVRDYVNDKDADMGRYYPKQVVSPSADERNVRYEMFRVGEDGYVTIAKGVTAKSCTRKLAYLQKHDPNHVYGLKLMSWSDMNKLNADKRKAYNDEIWAEASAIDEALGRGLGARYYLSEAASYFGPYQETDTRYMYELENEIAQNEVSDFFAPSVYNHDAMGTQATSWADRTK